MTQDGATNGVSTNLELEQHQANQVCKCQIFRQEMAGGASRDKTTNYLPICFKTICG